jgi:hypothetical protein
MAVATIRQWELAEIERSAREASRFASARLRTTESNLARYLSPPESTPFPLEYAVSPS